jgi:hypothetical protein
MTISTQCRCGHLAEAHEHFWLGDDARNLRGEIQLASNGYA